MRRNSAIVGPMTSRAKELVREALKLPAADRADVIAELLASLDEGTEPVEDVERAWAAEIERRAQRVLDGTSASVSWDDVRRRAEGDLRRP